MLRHSFEAADGERTVAGQRGRWRRMADGGRSTGDGRDLNRLSGSKGIEKRLGWREEVGAGDRAGEVEETIVVARRAADEHILDHLLDRPERAGIADEVGAGFAQRNVAEGHVVAE